MCCSRLALLQKLPNELRSRAKPETEQTEKGDSRVTRSPSMSQGERDQIARRIRNTRAKRQELRSNRDRDLELGRDLAVHLDRMKTLLELQLSEFERRKSS